MGRERKSNPRKMRPQFLVLCEGETEEAYINFLKQRYRLLIKIVPRVVGNKITPRLIKQHKKGLSGVPDTIRTFLMYDGDLSNVVENLQQCEGTLLLSTPCLEIWFIAHFKKTGENEISSEECVQLPRRMRFGKTECGQWPIWNLRHQVRRITAPFLNSLRFWKKKSIRAHKAAVTSALVGTLAAGFRLL